MSKVRINDLARELEVKSRPILDALTAVGVTEKKTHSSSIEADEAEKVRGYFKRRRAGASARARPPVEAKPKFDLSHVSKPGDALKAILERKQAEAAGAQRAAAASAGCGCGAGCRPPVAPPAAVGERRRRAGCGWRLQSRQLLRVCSAQLRRLRLRLLRRGGLCRCRGSARRLLLRHAAAPAIASTPPVGPVIARPPPAVAPSASGRMRRRRLWPLQRSVLVRRRRLRQRCAAGWSRLRQRLRQRLRRAGCWQRRSAAVADAGPRWLRARRRLRLPSAVTRSQLRRRLRLPPCGA